MGAEIADDPLQDVEVVQALGVAIVRADEDPAARAPELAPRARWRRRGHMAALAYQMNGDLLGQWTPTPYRSVLARAVSTPARASCY